MKQLHLKDFGSKIPAILGFMGILFSCEAFCQSQNLDSLAVKVKLPAFIKTENISREMHPFQEKVNHSDDSLYFTYCDLFEASKLGNPIPAYHAIDKTKRIEMVHFDMIKLGEDSLLVKVKFFRNSASLISIDLTSMGGSFLNPQYTKIPILEPVFIGPKKGG